MDIQDITTGVYVSYSTYPIEIKQYWPERAAMQRAIEKHAQEIAQWYCESTGQTMISVQKSTPKG
ncbi:hypothetical protein [Timonella senegalensis]|uniref:hypothetical protein n=1 Tax=Timonella senegalensis TaxID=1465825 RepID=UPI0005937AB7|nr:hypothetical protein [Timonella senegalensis]